MEVIFCNKDKEAVGFFNQLIDQFLGIGMKFIKSLSQGNKSS